MFGGHVGEVMMMNDVHSTHNTGQKCWCVLSDESVAGASGTPQDVAVHLWHRSDCTTDSLSTHKHGFDKLLHKVRDIPLKISNLSTVKSVSQNIYGTF